jgi:hypothetical protein
MQVGTENKSRQIRKRAVYTMKLASLSIPFCPPLYRRMELLASIFSRYILPTDFFVMDHDPKKPKSIFKTKLGILNLRVQVQR